jgi:hypothetical protein
MVEIYVDPDGMNGLYNQVQRATQDARAAQDQIAKYGDIPFYAEGIIFLLFGPHRQAHELIAGTIDTMAGRLSALGTAVNETQLILAGADTQIRQSFDNHFAGVPATEVVQNAINGMRPNAPIGGTPFNDVAEPSIHLQPPAWVAEDPSWHINYLWDALSVASWVRQLSIWLFHEDPFERWLSMLSGDWSAYYRCAVLWQQISGCSYDIGSNLLTAARDTPTVWRGNAATAAEDDLVGKTTVLDQLSDACLFYAARYRDAAHGAIECFDTVSDLVTDLIDALVYAQIAAAVGTASIETVIGGVIGYSVAAFYAARAIELYYEVEGAINTLKTTVSALAAAMDAYNAAQKWQMQTPAAYALPPHN